MEILVHFCFNYFVVNHCFLGVLGLAKIQKLYNSDEVFVEDGSSRWRGVFAHHQAQAVGKARRPFIRLS